jgi:DNA-binding NtrC family response regulator
LCYDAANCAMNGEGPHPSGPVEGELIPVRVGMTLAEGQRLLIAATLRHTGGNVKAAALILGIDRSTLYEKIKALGIEREKGTHPISF